jgi:predicted metal-dependent hydrolase
VLYSTESILIQNVEYQVKVYLKRTRNHSYRITTQKIAITLPDVYKNPETIDKHRKEWLQHATERVLSDKKLMNIVPFKNWETITLFGVHYPVISNESIVKNRYNPELNAFEVRTDISQDKLKDIFSRFVKSKFEKAIQNRVQKINQVTLNKPIAKIELKHHSSRWGSCSSKGEITISVNLLLAPIWVIDYVIVHELCHLVYMDHSTAFWREVQKYYPKYKEAVRYLKSQGLNLSL